MKQRNARTQHSDEEEKDRKRRNRSARTQHSDEEEKDRKRRNREVQERSTAVRKKKMESAETEVQERSTAVRKKKIESAETEVGSGSYLNIVRASDRTRFSAIPFSASSCSSLQSIQSSATGRAFKRGKPISPSHSLQ